ncbi:hypothetical protein OAH36_05335, partial [Verrucomicrobia bacterium]|nr:hypothetical protein [Verrucomicrobiota bacterium]
MLGNSQNLDSDSIQVPLPDEAVIAALSSSRAKGRQAPSFMSYAAHTDKYPKCPTVTPPLSSDSINTLVEWIDEGALSPADEIPEEHIHWAFKKPTSPAIPDNPTRFQTANPIDHFVFNRLASAKLNPSKRANPETLIR